MTLGLDCSEALVLGVAVDAEGRVQARAEHTLANVDATDAAQQVLARVSQAAGGPPMALGIAVSPDAGGSTAVREALAAHAPIVVAPGDAAVLAETWCGAAVGSQTLAVLLLGEHVTAGLQIDGRPWRGAHGHAASAGWLALNPVEREDYRRHGGFEAEVGLPGVVRRLVWRVKAGDHSSVVDQVGGDLGRISVGAIFDAARNGDGVCISVVRDTARYIGMAVTNIVAIVDPEVVVLSGVLATRGDMLIESILHECGRRLAPRQAGRLRVELSPLGLEGVAIGAARAAALAT